MPPRTPRRDEAPRQAAVLDLRALVAQMLNTEAFAWSTVQLLCGRQAAELVGALEEARALRQAKAVD